MAIKQYFVGSHGPYEYDDTNMYPDGTPHSAFYGIIGKISDDPIDDLDATNKKYVDGKVGNAQSFKVNDVFLNTDGVNPNAKLGYGEWTLLGITQASLGTPPPPTSIPFGGGLVPATSIINAFSSGGYSVSMPSLAQSGKQILSGALTAGLYSTVLTLSDSGVLTLAAAVTADTTSRTIGLKINIDGTTVFDAVSDTISTINTGVLAVGNYTGAIVSGIGLVSGWVPFNSSVTISVKSSLSETDKVKLYVAYHLT